jgi:UDP-hydrolysing UDP-N-acetyl-D-glucosamine 2-epimerase
VSRRTVVAAVTGSRADYGLLYWTLRRLREDARFSLRLVATGMHLDPAFGSTWRAIEADGFRLAAKVPVLRDGDDDVALAESMARGTAGLARLFGRLRPDVVLILGDRFEILSAASACLPLRIPVAHVHGGESTRGLIDDQIRHAVTKLSHLHFVSTEAYGSRLVRMGEEPWRVKVVGAAGIEFVRKLRPVPREELGRLLDLDWSRPVYLFTYHPVTLQVEQGARQLDEVLAAVARVPGQWVFTGTNADTGGRSLALRIRAFARGRDIRLLDNLGSTAYLSLMKWATAMVGNSSSGLLEAPSFGVPAVNIGDRQGDRLRGANVLDVPAERRRIEEAVRRASDPAFRRRLVRAPNPYDRGDASRGIVRVLARLPDRLRLVEKRFHDAT